jgi:DNA-binding NarL/FixJ family response regulator
VRRRTKPRLDPRHRQNLIFRTEVTTLEGIPPGASEPMSSMMLTNRQHEIAELAAAGLSNKRIARQLGISEGTVKLHMHGIFDRLGVRSRAILAASWRIDRRDGPDR